MGECWTWGDAGPWGYSMGPCPRAVAVTTGSGWGFQVAGQGPAPAAALLRWEPQDKASTLAFLLLSY